MRSVETSVPSLGILMAVLLGVVGCTGNKFATESVKAGSTISAASKAEGTANRQSPPSPAASEEVSLEWFTSSQLKPTDTVSASEAKTFLNNVYQKLDNKIFDPAFKQEERNRQLQELLTEIDRKSSWSRAELTERVSRQFKQLSVSHLKILDPVEGEKLLRTIEEKPLPNATPKPSISAEMRGEMGILTIRSFLIPQVTKSALDQAKSQLSQAKVMLIDVRGNIGGAGSSISYLVEDLLGGDKILWRDKTREGLTSQKPYIFRGYFEDRENAGAEAELKLASEQPFVEWRTRSDARRDPRPYFILVDGQCASSCDLFAGIVKNYGAGKILGTRTMGELFGADLIKLNWQGFAIMAPTFQVILPNGNTIEGVGVQPDIQIPECKNGGSQCLDKAIKIVNAEA
jgi:Peptidase family S41